jgi:effector-binding domain-containing protein
MSGTPGQSVLAPPRILRRKQRIPMNAKSTKWLIVTLLVASAWARADGPATQPAAKPDAPAAGDQNFVLSPMRVQELKGMNYEYLSTKTTLGQISDQIRQTMAKIEPVVNMGQVRPIGPAVIIFHGMNQDPSAPFTVEVGFPVADGAKPADGFEIAKLDKFRCATILFSGSMQDVHNAYEKLYTDLFAAGLTPSDESREAILLFEGEDSVNNVSMIQVGVR